MSEKKYIASREELEAAIAEKDAQIAVKDTEIANLQAQIGDLATLTTTDKTSLTNALNEQNGKMTMAKLSDYTISQWGGDGSLVAAVAHKIGNVIFATYAIKVGAGKTPGTTVFSGTLNKYLPLSMATGSSFIGDVPFGFTVESTGTVTMRILGSKNTPSEGNINVSVAYLTAN